MFNIAEQRPLPLPHIPDEPTDEVVSEILRHMLWGMSYYMQGAETALPEHAPPGGKAFKLEPVMGIHWKDQIDPNVSTVYIDGHPYQFSSTWVYTTLDRANKAKR